MPGCSSAAVPRSCLTSRSLWRQDRTFPRSPLRASSRKACGWPPRPGEVLCRGRTALGQTPGAVTSVRHDIAVQWRLISLSPAGCLFTSRTCCLLTPGCKSITAPILLGGDAEPWARRGGLFGELQVRARARLWGCRSCWGAGIPAAAPGPAFGSREGRGALGLCASAAAPEARGAPEGPSSCCLRTSSGAGTTCSLLGRVSSRLCCPWGTAVTSSTTHLRSSHAASCTCCAHCCPRTR